MEEIKKALETIAATDLTRPMKVEKSAVALENLLLNRRLALSKERELIACLRKNGILAELQALYETYETNLEINFAREIIRNNMSDYRRYPLYRRFLSLIKNELRLVHMENLTHALFTGSGPFPITAILLNKLTGCTVDCYEKNMEYADLSHKVISQLGLADKIRIFNRRGEYLTHDGHPIVVIAVLAKPKDKILQKVLGKISSRTRIICRTADGLRLAFYEAADPEYLKPFKIMGVNYADGSQTISSILLKKETSRRV